MNRNASVQSPPIEIDAQGLTPLGMSPEQFLRDYWQKHPVLIRNALPGYVSPVTPEDLAGLACEETALSRIVTHDWETDQWTYRAGPFTEEEFPTMPDHDWTLLVQDVDKWDPDIRELYRHFSFLPRWRFDDIMISFAATGGSVGAHIDQYDVFLLQGLGQRRWLIDANPNPNDEYRDDVALRLLQRFNPSHDWIVNPGDILYMPPGVPHHGIAVNPCLTLSLGLRAPATAELIGDYIDELLAQTDETDRYADPDIAVVSDEFEIDTTAMKRVAATLDKMRHTDPEQLSQWFGRFITRYRNAEQIVPYSETRTPDTLIDALNQGLHLQRHPWSRLAWCRQATEAVLFCDGDAYPVSVEDAQLLCHEEQIDKTDFDNLSPRGHRTLFALTRIGHYRLNDDEE